MRRWREDHCVGDGELLGAVPNAPDDVEGYVVTLRCTVGIVD